MIRDATPDDAAAVAAVYEPYVTGTSISFEDDPPDATEMARRIAAAHAWLVAVDEPSGDVVGFAYAGPFHHRPAYRWSTEVSIYLAPDATGRGIGRELVGALLDRLRAAGFVQAFAGIALPNPASAGLFESLGFVRAATYRAVGWKLGAWHDVGWWQLELVDPATVAPD